VRAVNAHRKDVRKVLITLFEQAVPASDTVSREVLTCILCNSDEDFTTPLLDLATNYHLKVLHSGGGISVCILAGRDEKECLLQIGTPRNHEQLPRAPCLFYWYVLQRLF
jgi:hypothetical protein